MKVSFVSALSTFLVARGSAFDYSIANPGSISMTDELTGITDIASIFIDDVIQVSVNGLEWEPNEGGDGTTLLWTTYVDGVQHDSGSVDLADVGRELPSSIDAGTIKVGKRGTSTVQVDMRLDDRSSSTSSDYQVYAAGVSIIPLILVLCMSLITRMVEFSLFSGIFVGACIVSGSIVDGFTSTLNTYLLNALSSGSNVQVILFTVFLSGMVGMMQKSGGMIGFTEAVSKIAQNPRLGQFACFCVGCFIFFDDYANVLLAGETMRPLLDTLSISREQLAFIVDATSAPIASISPISSWVGYEVGLIDAELERIKAIVGTDDLPIKTTGFGVFLQSIKYRYYPIFMLILLILLIFTQRGYGPMLIAERRTRVYDRTDGGDGKGRASGVEGAGANQPNKDTPTFAYNMVLPVLLLVAMIFYLLVKSGTIDGEDQSFMDKIESSDSYVALLYGTMGSAIITLLFYLIQFKRGGHLIMPSFAMFQEMWLRRNEKPEEDEYPRPRSLMSVNDSVESFLHGMAKLFPAVIVLTLAWASGSIMTDVGADRLFAAWIAGGIAPESLPTLSFVISFFMALATGTSWGTMAILFPLLLVPTYLATDGDDIIFYSVTAGVLSGSVAGDHVSPISDTTVLSALACDCTLVQHVTTQAPYVLFIVVVSILAGTLPIGHEAWPNMVGIVLGWIVTALFVVFMCRPVISATGNFDPMTELYLKFVAGGSSPLWLLKDDTAKKYAGESIVKPEEEKDGDEKEMALSDDDNIFVEKELVDHDEESAQGVDEPTIEESPSQHDDEVVAQA